MIIKHRLQLVEYGHFSVMIEFKMLDNMRSCLYCISLPTYTEKHKFIADLRSINLGWQHIYNQLYYI